MVINWQSKLASRKLWVSVTAVVICSCVLFGVDNMTTERIVALIGAVASCVTYVVCETEIDKMK